MKRSILKNGSNQGGSNWRCSCPPLLEDQTALQTYALQVVMACRHATYEAFHTVFLGCVSTYRRVLWEIKPYFRVIPHDRAHWIAAHRTTFAYQRIQQRRIVDSGAIVHDRIPDDRSS